MSEIGDVGSLMSNNIDTFKKSVGVEGRFIPPKTGTILFERIDHFGE